MPPCPHSAEMDRPTHARGAQPKSSPSPHALSGPKISSVLLVAPRDNTEGDSRIATRPQRHTIVQRSTKPAKSPSSPKYSGSRRVSLPWPDPCPWCHGVTPPSPLRFIGDGRDPS